VFAVTFFNLCVACDHNTYVEVIYSNGGQDEVLNELFYYNSSGLLTMMNSDCYILLCHGLAMN